MESQSNDSRSLSSLNNDPVSKESYSIKTQTEIESSDEQISQKDESMS